MKEAKKGEVKANNHDAGGFQDLKFFDESPRCSLVFVTLKQQISVSVQFSAIPRRARNVNKNAILMLTSETAKKFREFPRNDIVTPKRSIKADKNWQHRVSWVKVLNKSKSVEWRDLNILCKLRNLLLFHWNNRINIMLTRCRLCSVEWHTIVDDVELAADHQNRCRKFTN